MIALGSSMKKAKTLLHASLLSLGFAATGCVTGESDTATEMGELRKDGKNCGSDYAWSGMLKRFNICGSVAVLSSLPAGGGEATLSLPKLFADNQTVEFRLSLPPGAEDDTMVAYLTGNANDGPHGITLKYEPRDDGQSQAILAVWRSKKVAEVTWPAKDGDEMRWQISAGRPSVWINGSPVRIDQTIKLAPITPYDFIVGVVDTDASGSAVGMGIVALDVYGVPTQGGSDF